MPFSEIELKKIDNRVGAFCKGRLPLHLKDTISLEYRVEGYDVEIFERRPHWREPKETVETSVAKIKHVRKSGEWRLYWKRADLKWHAYEPLPSSEDLETLVKEVDEDPHACFFG